MNPAPAESLQSLKECSQNLREVLRNLFYLQRFSYRRRRRPKRQKSDGSLHCSHHRAHQPRKEKAAMPESGSGNAACSFR